MLHELLECLGGVADPRAVPRIEHRLIDVLAIAVCAVLAGAESFEDIALYGRSKRAWLSRFLELPNGILLSDNQPDRCRQPSWPAASAAGRA